MGELGQEQATESGGQHDEEEGTGSVAVGGKGSGIEVTGSGTGCSGAACVNGTGSLEGSVGSDQGGRATSSTDSCACAATLTANNIAATITDVLPTII